MRKSNKNFYEAYGKRMIDVILSIGGLIVLSPIFLIITIAIIIDDPGPAFFVQKRVGKNKTHFKLHKFRSMKMSTPHDTPTHLLENPEQYITRVGGFLRKYSLDELPQIWDIFVGDLSIVGPRPALWNQYDLIEERDKYGANGIKPGLTGWAQINGRDELEIPIKAKYDGYYVERLHKSSISAFAMDVKCFFGTIKSVADADGVVEGGTGTLHEKELGKIETEDVLVSIIIATYRRKDELRRAISSLEQQTHRKIEVILVDDNADETWTNEVEAIVRGFKDRLDIHYIVNEKNLGSAETRNKGIKAAKGAYITFLDDDDLYLPGKVSAQLEDMLTKEADYGITDLYLYNEKEELTDKRVRSFIVSTNPKELLRYHLLYHMTGTDTLMFKAEYLHKIGGFPGINVGDEFYMMKRAIMGKGKLAYSNHCHVKAYVHTGEMGGLSSGQGKIDGENALYREKKRYYKYLQKKDIRYINARHYAVLAFANLRMKKYGAFVANAMAAVAKSPIDSVKIILNR